MSTSPLMPFVRSDVSSRDLRAEAPRDARAPSKRPGRFDWVRKSRWLRTVLTSLFVLFMLAAAHLFMVAINAAETAVEAPHPAQGQVARLFGDRPLVEEVERALEVADGPAEVAALEGALAAARAGEPVAMRTLPVTPFIAWTAIALCAVGFGLLWLTSRLESDTAQTIVGIFAGNLIWTGGIEYGLVIASRSLGVGKAIGVVDGQLVAIYGEYVLLKHTWGLLVLVVAYLVFLESSRCSIFLWLRRRIPMMRGAIVSGRIGNYGPRSAFQYATICWAFYLLLLWAYDESVFGVYSYFTKGVLFASVAGTLYYVWRLHQQTGWGPALRYAIAAMVVAWTPVEIVGKWGVLRQPWLLLEPGTALFFFGGLALGTWALFKAHRRRARAGGKCPFHASSPVDDPAAADADPGPEGAATA
ncbi:MAG TPA: hypothetical protein RMH99_04995 [Sandaracinaceae bacterium LLY-WYZ-13_1]|nr:hypothetical protein [Sandaracinaceae bacterium LLY-WYZ-13_1]